MEHKVAFIKKYVPAGSQLRLIGHSIGCQMILKALDQLVECSEPSDPGHGSSRTSPQYELGHCYMLFPTIEKMKDTPRGQNVWPILKYFWWIPPFVGSLLSVLPRSALAGLVRMFFYDGSRNALTDNVVECAITNIRPDMTRNMLDLAFDELVNVTDMDSAAVTRHKNRLVFYYGTTDAWCPMEFREELIKNIPGVVSYLCQRRIDHSFVVRMPTQMAEEIVNIIREIESLELVQNND